MVKDIISLLKDVVSGLNYLSSKGYDHGQINLDTIFYSKEDQIFRIFDQSILTEPSIDLVKNNVKFTFLAPEQIIFLNDSDETYLNPKKSDIFALGLVALQLATLSSSSELYDTYSHRYF